MTKKQIIMLFSFLFSLFLLEFEINGQRLNKNIKFSMPFNREYRQTNGLMHYWPFKSNVKDIIGEAHLFDGVNAALSNDRFNRKLSSLRLVNGFYKIPPGVYFDGGDYTVMSWVYVRAVNYWSRILDFSVDRGNETVFFAFSYQGSGAPASEIYKGTSQIFGWNCKSFATLDLNKWQHVAFVFSNSTKSGLIFLNGTKVAQASNNNLNPTKVVRKMNYIGRSAWFPSDKDANADLDEIKIFNRALTQQEILFEMDNDLFF